MSIFKEIDFDAINSSINEVKKEKKEYVEVPIGIYNVKLNKLELRESKKGLPMVMLNYKIVDGDYESSFISQFQLLTNGMQFNILFNILDSLGSGIAVDKNSVLSSNEASEVEDNLRFLLADIITQTSNDGVVYSLDYNENAKGFKTFKILDVVKPSSNPFADVSDDDSLPFDV